MLVRTVEKASGSQIVLRLFVGLIQVQRHEVTLSGGVRRSSLSSVVASEVGVTSMGLVGYQTNSRTTRTRRDFLNVVVWHKSGHYVSACGLGHPCCPSQPLFRGVRSRPTASPPLQGWYSETRSELR